MECAAISSCKGPFHLIQIGILQASKKPDLGIKVGLFVFPCLPAYSLAFTVRGGACGIFSLGLNVVGSGTTFGAGLARRNPTASQAPNLTGQGVGDCG